MSPILLATLTAHCIFDEAYRTFLTIWVWPWLREGFRGGAELLELFEFLKPYLVPLLQVWAIWMYLKSFHSNFQTPWYATLPNSTLSKQLTILRSQPHR
jgi:hypothetical protein